MMEKYQKDIVSCLHEVIHASENITKAFPNETGFADLVARACRMAQQASHDFNESFSDYNQTGIIEAKWMKEAADKIEAIMSQLVRVVISGSFEQKYPELSSSVLKPQESMVKLLNSYRMFLETAQSNPKSNAKNAEMMKKPSFLNSNLSKEQENAFFKDLANVASPTAIFWQYAEQNRQSKQVLAPNERSEVIKQLCELPLWILDLALKERDSRLEIQAESVKRGLALDQERSTIRAWKTETLNSFRDAIEGENLGDKQETNEERVKRLESTIVLKDVEIKELEGRIVDFERRDMEMEQRYRMAKEALSKYMIEVEEWKRESSAKFTRYLAIKDKEINELKANNPSLDTARMVKESLNTAGIHGSTSSSGSSTPNSSAASGTPPPIPRRTDRTLTIGIAPTPPPKPERAGWMRATKLFKVQLPLDLPPLTVEFKENTTLENILDDIKEHLVKNPNSQMKPENLGDFAFYHVEGSETGNVIPLDYTVASLRFSCVRFGPKVQRVKSTKPLGEIIQSMQQSDANARRETTNPSSSGALVIKCFGFDIEIGDPKNVSMDEASRALTDIDKNTPYYSHYFKTRNHVNYFGEGNAKVGPVIVSLEVPSKEQKEMYQDNNIQLRALVRTKYDDEWVFINADSKNKKKSLQKALETDLRCSDKMAGVKLREVTGNGIEMLTNLEERLQTRGYKFGVLYVKPGQTDENKMFQNLHSEASADYIEFLKFLGETMSLKGFEGYRGGLDVKADATGTHSIAVKHAGFQIMFHIATLLPYFPNDTQQLERKRHLGNDVCVIVFKDSEDPPFNPQTIKSEFNHVFAVVCKDKSRTDGKLFYKLSFAYKGIGVSTPMLPFPATFEATPSFRDFFFTKLINSERSAMYAPSFVTKMQKTKELQMLDVVEKLKEIS